MQFRGTAGIGKPHPCLKPDWILGQFSSKRQQAEAKYREFVEGRMNEKDIWKRVKGQSILGKDNFVEELFRYVKGHEDVKEIPKNQRYVGRPALSEIFKGSKKDKRSRATAIRTTVYEHGYNQKEIADFIGIHYSTISRTVNRNEIAQNKT